MSLKSIDRRSMAELLLSLSGGRMNTPVFGELRGKTTGFTQIKEDSGSFRLLKYRNMDSDIGIGVVAKWQR